MKEYESLRQEILVNSQIIAQYNALLYTVTVAVLAFAFDKENPFLCLIPYVVIIPIYLLNEWKRKSNCNIASYMLVFLEGTDYKWETRTYKRTSSNKQQNAVKHILSLNIPERMPYLIIACICSLSTICKTIISDMTDVTKYISTILVFLFTIWMIIVMIRNTEDDAIIKTSCIERWQAVKASEEQEARKRNATRNPQ